MRRLMRWCGIGLIVGSLSLGIVWGGQPVQRAGIVWGDRAQGGIVWVYRDHRYGVDDGEWFLHGLFA